MSEQELGSTANHAIPLWDRGDIMKFLERKYGEDFFVNGESVITTNEQKNVKLIQLKLDTGEYKNVYFCLF